MDPPSIMLACDLTAEVCCLHLPCHRHSLTRPCWSHVLWEVPRQTGVSAGRCWALQALRSCPRWGGACCRTAQRLDHLGAMGCTCHPQEGAHLSNASSY